MTNYGDQLINWMKREGINDEKLSSYFQSNADNKSKEMVADLYVSLQRQQPKHSPKEDSHPHENEMVHLEPYKNADGSFGYIDRMRGGVVVSVTRHPNGLFSFLGPRKYLEILGGRGSLSGIVDRMSDGDYFNKG